MRDLQFSQTCLKGSPEGTHENMLLKTGDLLYNAGSFALTLAAGIPKRALQKTSVSL